MTFFNVYIVVSPDNIHFGEQFSIFKYIKKVINVGQWGFIFDSEGIDFSIILDKAVTSIFFAMKKQGLA